MTSHETEGVNNCMKLDLQSHVRKKLASQQCTSNSADHNSGGSNTSHRCRHDYFQGKETNSCRKRRTNHGVASSERVEHVLGAAVGERAALLEVDHLDHAVLREQRVAAGPDAEPHGLVGEVELDAHGARQLAVAVRQEQHLVPDPQTLLPRAHHEGVVDGDAGHGVDALGAELPGLGHEPREVLLGAGGRERAGHGEEHHLLPRGEVADRHRLQLAVGGGRVEVGERRVREPVPDRDGLGRRRGGRRRRRRHGPDWRAKEPPEGCPGGQAAGGEGEGGGGGGARQEDALTGGGRGGGQSSEGGGSHGDGVGGDAVEELAWGWRFLYSLWGTRLASPRMEWEMGSSAIRDLVVVGV
jgi:hypothetical protein